MKRILSGRTRRILGAALVAGLLWVTATAVEAQWDSTMSAYAQLPSGTRVSLIAGYLGAVEGAGATRWCGVTVGTIQETIDQWYRMGKVDPMTRVSIAVFAALQAHGCVEPRGGKLPA
jgi:hypothetical protein